jgi:hypothetical protein
VSTFRIYSPLHSNFPGAKELPAAEAYVSITYEGRSSDPLTWAMADAALALFYIFHDPEYGGQRNFGVFLKDSVVALHACDGGQIPAATIRLMEEIALRATRRAAFASKNLRKGLR